MRYIQVLTENTSKFQDSPMAITFLGVVVSGLVFIIYLYPDYIDPLVNVVLVAGFFYLTFLVL